ncbi:MAG: hypothetical protein IPP17_15505 [Bacteroidetes bacterium]|nr:hypothetical protein [Bacteroidota bacterium]
MSKNQSWLQSGSSYFSEGKMWRLIGCAVMLLISFMVLWNYMPKAHEKGYVINQGDIVQHKGMTKEIVDFRKANDDKEPLWTNAMFGGMPTYQISTWYPNNLMQKLDNIMNLRDVVPHPIGSMFLLFVTMCILLMTLKVDPFSSAVAAFGFMMCTYYFSVIGAGHNSKVNAVAYMPLVLAGVLLLYRGRFWLGAALTILAMGLEINANHLQITYYGFFVVGAIVLSELTRTVNNVGKGIAWTAFLSILISWAAGLPKIVWMAEGLLLFGVPLVLAFLNLRKEGNSMKAWLTGKDITAAAKPMRTFLVATVLMGLCMGISIAPNISRLWTTNEYVSVTMRGGAVHPREAAPTQDAQPTSGGGLSKEYAYVWSYGVAESFTIINPFYFGDAAHAKLGKESATYDVLKGALNPQGAEQLANAWPAYIGTQPMHGGPTYMGIVICFLFVLGLFIVPTRYRWWILGAALVSLMLSWGRNFQWFSDLFFDNLPKYNNFRAVSMWLTITSICMALMAGLALAELFRNSAKKTPKQQATTVAMAAGAIVLLLLILAWVHPGADLSQAQDANAIAGFLNQVGLKNPDPQLISALTDALPADREEMITSQAYKGILITLIAAGTLIGYVMTRKSVGSLEMKPIGIGVVGLILFGLIYWDMVPVDKRYLDDDNFIKSSEQMRPFTPSPCDQAIKKDPDPNYRVLNLTGNTWNDAMTSYHHKSIGGYSAVKMQRYQDLIDFRFDDERQEIMAALNTRDSTQMQKIQAALAGVTALNMLNCKYIMYAPEAPPIPNPSAMGHAWVVGNYEVVKGPKESMTALEGLDLRAKMVVEEADAEVIKGFTASPDPSATVKLTAWQSNEVKYQFSSTGGKEQLVAFSEVYYNSGKGWQAYVDGQPVDHFRCDYTLRGMKVPAGNHEIVFKMEPKSYATGESLALVFSLILFGLSAAAVFMDFKTGGKDDEEETGDAANPKTV